MILTKIIEGSCTLAIASISPPDRLILTAILSIFGNFPLIFPHELICLPLWEFSISLLFCILHLFPFPRIVKWFMILVFTKTRESRDRKRKTHCQSQVLGELNNIWHLINIICKRWSYSYFTMIFNIMFIMFNMNWILLT